MQLEYPPHERRLYGVPHVFGSHYAVRSAPQAKPEVLYCADINHLN